MKTKQPKVYMTVDASGAYNAAINGHVVVIVDIIDMSTSLETALEMGAAAVFGASPDHTSAPVPVNPEKIAGDAAFMAHELNMEVVIIGEPRFASKEEQKKNCQRLVNKLIKMNTKISDFVPNVGKELWAFAPLNNKIAIAATSTGGVAFDAAYNAGGIVTTATIARTRHMKGKAPALKGIHRAYSLAVRLQRDISYAAASSKSYEDILAAKYLCDLTKGLS
ncbi:hypothetical protein [Desulfitibacter alkalitolerans]|uniref:hypothetical protein n=1 Tax=Desulfitibacter alkalitolerans TaxID=264641 RepID=UPI000484C4A3|nr:hypothetical protein [Desulfitibacter alkalitolerans]